MAIYKYLIVYEVVCNEEGLVSHTLKNIKEVVVQPDEDEDEGGEENGD